VHCLLPSKLQNTGIIPLLAKGRNGRAIFRDLMVSLSTSVTNPVFGTLTNKLQLWTTVASLFYLYRCTVGRGHLCLNVLA
jgi:hypothetical protein